jgi:surfeit locus 1 family protein
MTMNPDEKPVKHWMVLLYILCLSLLLGLGGWQLYRGFEKSRVQESLAELQSQNISLRQRPENWAELQYKTVQLEGRWFAEKNFLLDNRVYKGRLGYEWLHPFELIADASVVLVNRGWVEKSLIAETGLVEAEQGQPAKVTGQFYLPEPGFTLGPSYTSTASWPVVIQYFDRNALSQALDVDLEPGIVVLDSNPDRGLTRIWSPYIIDASRHYGYALQWWGLALVLIIFGYIWSRNSYKNF